jgi:hypothetical protein
MGRQRSQSDQLTDKYEVNPEMTKPCFRKIEVQGSFYRKCNRKSEKRFIDVRHKNQLLAPKGDDGVDACGASCREKAGREGHERQQGRH